MELCEQTFLYGAGGPLWRGRAASESERHRYGDRDAHRNAQGGECMKRTCRAGRRPPLEERSSAQALAAEWHGARGAGARVPGAPDGVARARARASGVGVLIPMPAAEDSDLVALSSESQLGQPRMPERYQGL